MSFNYIYTKTPLSQKVSFFHNMFVGEPLMQESLLVWKGSYVGV